MITQYFEIRQWHLEVQLTRVCWIQTGSATVRTQSASLLSQSCQLHQRGFTASFLFWWERLWLWPGKVNSAVQVGDFALIITGLSTYLHLQIFKEHEKENKLNCNSTWNQEGVDFAFHWRLADKTYKLKRGRLNPPTKLIQIRYWHWPQVVESFQRFLLLSWTPIMK